MKFKGCNIEIVNADLFGGYAFIYVIETKNNLFIIDAGIESSKEYLDSILINNKKPISLLITHGHWDHVALASYLKNKYHATIYANKDSIQMMSNKQYQLDNLYDRFAPNYSFSNQIKEVWKKEFIDTIICDKYLNEGDEFIDDVFSLVVYKTPGHSSDQLSFFNKENKIIFTGDTIQSRGYNNHPALYENKDELLNSINTIKTLNPKIIFGGHFFISEPDSCDRYINDSFNFVKEIDEFVHNNPHLSFDELLKLFIKKYNYEYSMHCVMTLSAHKKENN